MSTLRHLPVPELKERYGLRAFVETGTLDGDGVAFALSCGFERLYSCDIVTHFVGRAKERFRYHPEVEIFCGDSLAFIRSLPVDLGPAFWWLDAHQPAFYDSSIPETRDNKFPVMQELELIRQRPGYERDVIVIDDLIVLQGSPRWHPGEVCDYFQINSFTYEALVASMAATHQAEYSERMEGILTFIPK